MIIYLKNFWNMILNSKPQIHQIFILQKMASTRCSSSKMPFNQKSFSSEQIANWICYKNICSQKILPKHKLESLFEFSILNCLQKSFSAWALYFLESAWVKGFAVCFLLVFADFAWKITYWCGLFEREYIFASNIYCFWNVFPIPENITNFLQLYNKLNIFLMFILLKKTVYKTHCSLVLHKN